VSKRPQELKAFGRENTKGPPTQNHHN